MRNVTSLLQDADPLRHEPARFDAERDRIRRAIVAAVPAAAVRSRRMSLSLVAAVPLTAIGLAAIGYQLWLRGATPVAAAVRFEVRLAEAEPAPGLLVARVAGSDRFVYLHQDVVV